LNINRVILTGNLTKDPDLRATNSGMNVCSLRLAVNSRRKDGATGQWVEEPNYFDVTVFGAQGENCARFLTKGRPVAVDGRLKWREFTDQQGNQRQAVEIIADAVQFLGGRDEGQGGGGGFAPRTDVPVNTSDFSSPPVQQQPQHQPAPVPAGAPADDDIPF
jgi:single-strand DNA-binding protein